MSYEDKADKLNRNTRGMALELGLFGLCVEADNEIEAMKKVLVEAMRLLKNGANGSIPDTVWSDSTPNTTLYELMHNVTNGKDKL